MISIVKMILWWRQHKKCKSFDVLTIAKYLLPLKWGEGSFFDSVKLIKKLSYVNNN